MLTYPVVIHKIIEKLSTVPSRKWHRIALILFLFTSCMYYGSFYNYSFNLGDEGSVALISEKIFNGEVPFKDIEIGYNVMWYYPISWLFTLTGVNFNLIKIYFLAIALVTSLFAYALLLRLTSNRFLAILGGMLVLFFPGTVHKTYIPFLIISGLYITFLYNFNTAQPFKKRFLALLANGIFLAFAYLIRPDIAGVYTILLLFYHIVRGLFFYLHEKNLKELLIVPFNIVGITAIVILVTLPFALQANKDGYHDRFIFHYKGYWYHLVTILQTSLSSRSGSNQSSRLEFIKTAVASDSIGPEIQEKANSTAATAGKLLQRVQLTSFFDSSSIRAFIILTYFPLLMVIIVCFYLLKKFVQESIIYGQPTRFISHNIYLASVFIGTFSAFPQFFYFRPDFAHLSQFTPGFIIFSLYFLYVLASDRIQKNKSYIQPRSLFLIISLLTAAYISVYAYSYNIGLSLRTERHYKFEPGKGIKLHLNRSEFEGLNGLYTKIRETVKPGQFLLCFPYCPGIIFMADRPTFQKHLYVDDSFLIANPRWLKQMQEEIEQKKPKMILISDWAINETEISRFKNWAKPLYTYIENHYFNRGEIMGFQVFVLE